MGVRRRIKIAAVPSLRLTNNIQAEIWHCNLHLHTEANPSLIQIHFHYRLILQINHAAQNGSDLYFPTAQSRKSSNKKLRCGRVFMENMNEGSMQLLCLLISPQGLGNITTLQFYNHGWSAQRCTVWVWVWVCVLGQTRSCLLKRSSWISGHESGCPTSSRMILLTNNMLDKWRKVCLCTQWVCVCAFFWGGGGFIIANGLGSDRHSNELLRWRDEIITLH